jgi:aminomethyltransferase
MTKPQKLSPLHDTAQQLGARFITQAGWQVVQDYGNVESEIDDARQSVALADMSANGKLLIEGESAGKLLQATWNLPELAVGAGAAISDGLVFRLRSDQFFLNTPPGDEAKTLQHLTHKLAAQSEFVTLTDITHGQAELRLCGPNSSELLSRLCGLDFHPESFPNMTAKQSSLAKTRQLIIRRDLDQLPAYTIIGARSLVAYLWGTILEAGRDLAIRPIGQAALEKL